MSGMDERLNGLLDGELSPAEAAETASVLRDDPSLATRFADLARLRANTATIDANMTMPPIPEAPTRRFVPWPMMLAGAGLIALSVVATLLISQPAQEPPPLAAHRHFLFTAADAAGATAGLPDLSAAGLRLARIEPAGGGTYAGYVGPRGCRLGVWLGPRDGLPPDASRDWRSETMERADGMVLWIVATLAMDADRFAALAEALRSGPAAGATLLASASARSACLS
ncbi:anti-sigma factor family protein [Pseudoroseomonas globiformis]|uniref:Anti-sigma factor family protein n=1 Tax=Teichococcus globiformis TaxID=2307229 RepID=A0ABV7G1H7_9PROT